MKNSNIANSDIKKLFFLCHLSCHVVATCSLKKKKKNPQLNKDLGQILKPLLFSNPIKS